MSIFLRNFITDKRLTTIKFNKDDILKIIRNLNVNEAHGRNDISVRVLNICNSVVTEPLPILLKTVLIVEYWKMSHIIPTHRKMMNVI